MKFFVDTANLEQIKGSTRLGYIGRRYQTNPSLVAKEGIVGKEKW